MLKKVVNWIEEHSIENRTDLREKLKSNPIVGVNNTIVEGIYADFKKDPEALKKMLKAEEKAKESKKVKTETKKETPKTATSPKKARREISLSDIKEKLESMTIQEIADDYGVCYLTMHRIIHNNKLVEEPLKTGRPALKITK